MRHLLLLIFLTPLFLRGQTDSASKGISFVSASNWKEVLKRAKKENKFIFIDCYATWCVPCKEMEKKVFSSKKVGEFFNKNFISIRLQMNRNEGDDENVKRWRGTAISITKEFGIPTYPTFLFFSSDGRLVYRDAGLKFEDELLGIAKKAIQPDISSPFVKYYSLLAEYQRGIRNYSQMAFLANTAKQLNQDEVAEQISKVYKKHLLGKSREELFTPADLVFIANFMQGSKDSFFQLFYDNIEKVDSIVKRMQFAQFVIDTIIQHEEIDPIAKLRKGARTFNESVKDEPEPNWQFLFESIAAKYTRNYAERNILYSRAIWYRDHFDWTSCAKLFTQFIQKYPPRSLDGNLGTFINHTAWQAIFLRSVDKDQIDVSVAYLTGYIKFREEYERTPSAVLDTYANLLYKAGKVNEAIKMEEMAINRDPSDLQLVQTLGRMKNGKPTWPRYIGREEIFTEGLID